MIRYSLQVKQVSPAGGGAPGAGGLNPAMVNRGANVPMDEGRPWAGDLYEEGAVSDPSDAYAHFGSGEETEAWLDRNEDGTLTGWVRDGDDVWRYSDPEAWALDVDGVQMQRVDGGTTDAPVEGDPAVEGDPMAVEGEPDPADPLAADQDALVADDAALEAGDDPLADDEEFENPFAIADDQGEAVEDAEDEDAEDEAIEDEEEPTDVDGDALPDDEAEAAEAPVWEDDPDAEGHDEPDADDAPAADEATEDGDADDEPDADDDDLEDDDEDEDEDGPETPADQLFKKKGGQKKSLDPGILAGPERRPRGTVRPRRRR